MGDLTVSKCSTGSPVEDQAGPSPWPGAPAQQPRRSGWSSLGPSLPSPGPSLNYSPPRPPRGAPGTLEGETVRSSVSSGNPQPFSGRTPVGVPGLWLGVQTREGGRPWRPLGRKVLPPAEPHPWGRTVAAGRHADLRAHAEKRRVLWTEAAFCDGDSVLKSPVGTAEGRPGPCALQGRGRPARGPRGGSMRRGGCIHEAGVVPIAVRGLGRATGQVHLVRRAGERCVEGEDT